ncbi:hypothetical protein K505DRAFT_123660 [Melanomma pulvis-pyrius CBS 109.77]|uniref:Uncharacterized protein n=1 Tax=Melanomma pulvis-pyrius CBS 109.77 TaxID=1314802 RepID=A0A6A6WUQ6_9PLEO|nr:hypothetical protein K505DRAFT_123660 [Melanomma pulvis-pyrius CBS 109.77]
MTQDIRTLICLGLDHQWPCSSSKTAPPGSMLDQCHMLQLQSAWGSLVLLHSINIFYHFILHIVRLTHCC